MKKIVIIGGGLSGIYCAALMSKKKRSIMLLEQHLTVGGLAAGFYRKGYYFDSSVSRFVSDMSVGYFKRLGIYEKANFIKRTAVLNIEGAVYAPKNVEDYFDILAKEFSEQKKGLITFYKKHVKKTTGAMKASAKTGAISYNGFKLIPKMLRMMFDVIFSGNLRGISGMIKDADIDFEEILCKYIDKNSKLFSILTGGYYDYFWKNGRKNLMTFCGYLSSTFELNKSPKRGFQFVCDEIADTAKKNGVEIITGALATKIKTAGNKAAAVTYIKAGKEYDIEADIVISASDLKKTYFELLDKDKSDAKILDAISDSEATAPMPILYLGIKVPSGKIAGYFVGKSEMVFFPKIVKKDENISEADFYKYAPFIIHTSSVGNIEHAPKDCCNLQIYLACPKEGWQNNWGIVNGKKTEKYKEIKKAAIELILSNLEKIIPDIKDRNLIEVCELGTPHTIERFTQNSCGASCGFSWDKRLNKVNKGLGKMHYKHEHIKNLYFIGHWTGYMGGITNALMSAKKLNKKL